MRGPTGLLSVAVAALLLCSGPLCRADIAEGEDTSLKNLAWHDGMVIFNGALRQTIPPNATTATAAAAVPCACSDAAPRDTSSLTPPFLVTVDCFNQANFGNCNASFMQTYLTELVFNQGFCQISCGRCGCCTPPTDVLKKMGATRFLQAVQVAQPSLLDLLAHPGYTGTVLVPTDAAFDAALAAHPGLLQDAALLQQVLAFHILPPEPRTNGLWTTPFMAVGANLYTYYGGNATIRSAAMPISAGTTANGGLTGIQLKGPVNSATVVGPSDLGSCKAYLTAIDTVLLPFDPALVAAAPAGSQPLAVALGAGPQCSLQAAARLDPNVSALVAGSANRQHSVGDCCASCQRTAGCTAYQYCALRGGCRLADGTAIKFGECELMRDPNAAAGTAPAWVDFSGATPLISGYVMPAPTAAAAGRRLMWS